MEAKELMIGDWVYDEILKCNTQVEMLSLSGIRGDCHDNIWNEKTFEPIPLTAEILEKNGWKEAQFWHEYKDGKNTIQSCLPDMRGIINGVEIQHFQCEYVHQYQHLLRLCGLNELADSMII